MSYEQERGVESTGGQRKLLGTVPDRLMLITQSGGQNSLPAQIEGFMGGGGQLVQLRIKGYCARGLENEAQWARDLCQEGGARLVVNDYVDVAAGCGAWGVHLGLDDMPVAQARKRLGPDVVIGATAHNFQEAVAAAQQGADYLGVGPLRFTSTKDRLAPILGFDGVVSLLRRLDEAGIKIPVYVVGGVESTDVRGLILSGAFGVAVSASIALASDPAFATDKFLESIYKAVR